MVVFVVRLLVVAVVVVIVVAVDVLVNVVLFGVEPLVVAAVVVGVVVVVVTFVVKISSPPMTLELGPSTILEAGLNLAMMWASGFAVGAFLYPDRQIDSGLK